MKKIFLLCLLGMAAVAGMVHSEEDFVISTLPKLNLTDPNIVAKIDTYNKLKMDAFLPSVLNGIVGFGSGSFAQNDTLFGIINLIGDVGGATILITDMFIISTHSPIYPATTPRIDATDAVLLSIGFGIIAISRIIEIIRPGMFAYDYNKALWNSLFQ